MKKALVIYQSKTGITKRFGEELGKYLQEKGLETRVVPIQEYRDISSDQHDIVLLGCWTAGFMLLFQHPDRPWKKFAAGLPDLADKKLGLFTTYKIATGSMFKNMQKHLAGKSANVALELKSRNGQMAESHKQLIDSIIS